MVKIAVNVKKITNKSNKRHCIAKAKQSVVVVKLYIYKLYIVVFGAIAQLAERLHRIQEAGGATPPSSIYFFAF